MASSAVERIGTFAFYSRILVLCLQAFFNNFIPDHDPDVFMPPNPGRPTPLDQAATIAFDGYKRWDAVYFLHIAEHGYTYENCLAFFPLYPLIVQLTADSVLFPLQYVMSTANVLLVAASILNFWFFVQAAKVFYRLSLYVLRDETLAFKAAQLFCINPASIFFSACYTESLYCLLTLTGMLQFEKKNYMNAAFFFALSGATRSNGIVNLGFLLYAMGMQFLGHVKEKESQKANLSHILISTIVPTMFYSVVCVVPYLIFQYYAYTVFCDPDATASDLKAHILNYGNERGYKMAHTGLSPYCYSALPFSYSYVQSNHWGVGFLSYYEYKQLPNFMLAAPMVGLCVGAIVCYSMWFIPKLKYDTAGKLKKDDNLKTNDVLDAPNEVQDVSDIPPMSEKEPNEKETGDLKERIKRVPNEDEVEEKVNNDNLNDESKNGEEEDANEVEKESEKEDSTGLTFFCQRRLLVYVAHLAFLTLVAVFFMHVQVTTRFMCSATPIVFWFVACITTPDEQLKARRYIHSHVIGMQQGDHMNGKDETVTSLTDDMMDWDNKSITNKLIFCYFHLYFFVGIAAFSNWLPWT